MATSSPTGEAGSWTPPEPLPIPEGREAAVLVHWDDRTAVYASGAAPQGRVIQRSYREDPGQWTDAEGLWSLDPAQVNGAPDPLVVEPGVLCMAFDGRSNEAFPPLAGRVYFGCDMDFSCTEAPLFGGVQAIDDPDPCQTGMLVVHWDPPLHYGSSQIPGARYYVYRDTEPDFTPSGANRIAGPVVSTFFIDSTVSPDTRYYYVVRAENFEDCPTGGPRGGMMDDNEVRLSGVDRTPLPPAGLLEHLRAEPLLPRDGGVALVWPETAGAVAYNIYRMDGDLFLARDLVLLAEGLPDTAIHVDMGEEQLAFFLVRPVSDCGVEGD